MAELDDFPEEDLLLSDDLMPSNTGSQTFNPLPHENAEQDHAEKVEKAMILGATPLLDEIFKWLDFAIEDCDSIRNLDTKSSVSLESQLVGMKHAKEKLVVARGRLSALKQTYIKDSMQ